VIVGPNPMLECRACCLLESLAVASAVVLYSSSYLCFPFYSQNRHLCSLCGRDREQESAEGQRRLVLSGRSAPLNANDVL
jgi:hypothetical protein